MKEKKLISDHPKLEVLSEYAHDAWSKWVKYMFSKCFKEKRTEVKDRQMVDFETDNLVIPRESVERWTRQMNTPYEKLTAEEKFSDIAEATKIIKIFIEGEEHQHEHEPVKGLKEHKCYFFEVKQVRGNPMDMYQVEQLNEVLQKTLTGSSGGFIFSDAITINIVKEKIETLKKKVEKTPGVGYFSVPDCVESIKIKECIVKFK